MKAYSNFSVSMRTQALCLVLFALNACGGGGGGGTGSGGAGGGAGGTGPASFSVSGVVSGLSGTLVLLDNSADDLTINTNGQFTFTTKLATGATYNVAIKSNPTSQSCSVANSGGSLGSADVTNVVVACRALRFLVKDVMSNQTDASGKLNTYHTIYRYDDKAQIVGVDQATSPDVNHPEIFVVTNSSTYQYDAAGRLVSLKKSGERGWAFQYTSDFVITAIPDNFDSLRDATVTWSFNVRGHNEIDTVKGDIPDGSGYTIGYYYNDTGGVQSSTAMDAKGVTRDQWASFSVGVLSAHIPNPFVNGTTIEQRLVYFGMTGAQFVGPNWPTGVWESYVYIDGTRTPFGHFYFTYTVDGNNNVTKMIPFSSGDAPGFNTWTQSTPILYTYEPH